ncbi:MULTISPECIES: hypothetical protein [Brevibacillus]|uniref:hypothetical protein n=1 Tax=Brevibacillus TaxID=55080 RepID=UPI00387809B0
MSRNIILAPLFSKVGVLIVTYSALLVALTYYIGFVYAQGSVMALTKISNIWNIGFEFVPASLSLYLVNGVSYIHARLLDMVVGALIMILYYTILYFPRTPRNRILIYIDTLRTKRFWSNLIKGTIIIFIPMGCMFLYAWDSSPGFIKYLNSLAVAVFLISLLIINNEYEKANQQHFGKIIVSLFLVIALVNNFLLLTLHVFLQGMLAQKTRLDTVFVEGSDKTSITAVYSGDKSSVDYYISFDLTSDYFIGYNINTENLDKIPKDKIKKIENHTITKLKEVRKYSPDEKSQANVSKDVLDQTTLVRNYYEYGVLGKKEPTKWLALISDRYYQVEWDLISPALLKKVWSSTDTLNGLPTSEYLGMEMSVPEENTIWVLERWKNQKRYTVFKFIKNGTEWRIGGVDTNWQPFRFIK